MINSTTPVIIKGICYLMLTINLTINNIIPVNFTTANSNGIIDSLCLNDVYNITSILNGSVNGQFEIQITSEYPGYILYNVDLKCVSQDNSIFLRFILIVLLSVFLFSFFMCMIIIRSFGSNAVNEQYKKGSSMSDVELSQVTIHESIKSND